MVVPVRPGHSHKPVYYLIFVTRHMEGMATFAEQLSFAAEKWRRAVALPYAHDDTDYAYAEEIFRDEEQLLQEAWVGEIATNISRLLAHGGPVPVLQNLPDVLGSGLGLTRDKHLRAAWRLAASRGLAAPPPKGKLIARGVQLLPPTA